jgi:hypothetical protein
MAEKDVVADYYRKLELIDQSGTEVSKWEANFLEHLLHDRPGYLSVKQKSVIDDMAEKYLNE